MRVLLRTLLVAGLLPLGAQALAAQQPEPAHAASHTTHHVKKHHRTHHAATRHARAHTTRASTTGVAHASTSANMKSTRGMSSMNGGMSGGLSRMANGLITEQAARSIALRSVSGGTSIDKVTFHTEDGRQVYDVKVLTPNQPGNETVRVDAATGDIVKTKHVDDPAGSVKRAVDRNLNKIRH